MATLIQKITSLKDYANSTTGKNDADLTNAVKSLAEGYGQGGEPWDETDPDNIIIEGEPTDVPVDTLTEFLNVRGYKYLFYNSTVVDAPWFDTSSVTDVSNMFYNCSYLKSVPLLDTSNVTNMTNMFYNCAELPSVPLLDTSNVTNMTNMFNGCRKLSSVPLLDTSNVTNMSKMFNGCYVLTTVPLLDTSNVTNMSSMFNDCSALTSVPLFDTSNATNIDNMFNGCKSLTSVPLFNTRKLTKMLSVFYGCSALTSVPELDARNVTDFNSMFADCVAITYIGIKNIKTNIMVAHSTGYGTLLTVDSLIHLIYELIKQSSSRTLTVGTANLEKLANVYVKAIDITDEMRAEDDLVDEKYPFVVCDSTDEGAVLITTYASTIKNWTIK